NGSYAVAPEPHRKIARFFSGQRLDDEGTKRVMREVHDSTGEVVDPHTAVGIHAGRTKGTDGVTPPVALATAHPAKFPDAVRAALGVPPQTPAPLAAVFNRTERFERIANDVDAVKRFILGHVST